MPDYRRANVPGGTYFFTVNTYRRQTFLTGADVRTALQSGRFARRIHFASMLGCSCLIIYMPFVHCLPMITISPTAGESSSASSLKLAQRGSTDRSGQRSRRRQRHQSTLWQHRFWEHLIRDEDDFNQHVDYLHWNPVKHGYVGEVKDWPYSSFHRYVKRGLLPLDWGSTMPLSDGDTFGERKGADS